MITLMKGEYRELPLKTLDTIPITSRGERSDRWKGVQHGELVHRIIDTFAEHKLKPVNPKYYVSPNNAAILGGFELTNGKVKKVPDLPHDTLLSFGFIHSNDSQRALRFVMGGKVAICENGLVVGSFDLCRKHTIRLDLVSWVREGIDRYMTESQNVGDMAIQLQDTDVRPSTHERGLVRLARANAIPWRLLGHVDAAWKASADNPKDPFHDRTAWSWLNHCTDVGKQIPVVNQYSHLHRVFQVASRINKR